MTIEKARKRAKRDIIIRIVAMAIVVLGGIYILIYHGNAPNDTASSTIRKYMAGTPIRKYTVRIDFKNQFTPAFGTSLEIRKEYISLKVKNKMVFYPWHRIHKITISEKKQGGK